GDDPYDWLPQPDTPAEWLLIDQKTFDKYFNANIPSGANLSRRPVEIAVYYPGDQAVRWYCEDVFNGLGHADGRVYKDGFHLFAVAQLEAAHLWETLADLALTSPGPQCKFLQVP